MKFILKTLSVNVRIEETEKQHLIEVLDKCQWNKKKTAEILGIGRNTLYVKLK